MTNGHATGLRANVDRWAGTTARWLGILCIVAGLVGLPLTGAANPVLFGTGVTLISGGAAVEVLASSLKQPPAPPPAPKSAPDEA